MPGLTRLLVWVGAVAVAAILGHVVLTSAMTSGSGFGRFAGSSCAACH
jgi:hypothetical protein